MRDNTWVGLEEGDHFPAYVDPDADWNGFAIPTFTRATVDHIARVLNERNLLHALTTGNASSADAIIINDDGTVAIYEGQYVAEEGEDYIPVVHTPDQHGRYALGAMMWTWTTTATGTPGATRED